MPVIVYLVYFSPLLFALVFNSDEISKDRNIWIHKKKRKRKMTGTWPGVHCQKYLLIIGSYSYTTRHTCIHTQACTRSTHLSSSSERTNLYILYWTPHHHLSSLSLPCHAPFPFPIHPYRHKHAHTHTETRTHKHTGTQSTLTQTTTLPHIPKGRTHPS